MLTSPSTGVVLHTAPAAHHAIRRPSRTEAHQALVDLTVHLENLSTQDYMAAHELRKARDILARVVHTAY